MKNTKHNHSFSEDQLAQLSYKKLTSDQIKLIPELYKAGPTPTSIREALVQQNLDQTITQNPIHNAITRVKVADDELNGLTPIQFLIEQLDEKTYKFETVVVNGEDGRVEYLFILRKDLLSVHNRYDCCARRLQLSIL